MEIEIVTTKKKLSKSIVNQMREASIFELQLGTAMGFLINVRKGIYKAILIQCEGEFFVVSANYTKGKIYIYRKIGKRSFSRKFDSPELCDSWRGFYQKRMSEAVDQIFV